MTETKGLKIETYERAQRLEAQAETELNKLKTNPRWDLTSGCSDVTAVKSKQYCEQVLKAQARLSSAGSVLDQGRPAAKDAGPQTLAWVLGADEAKVRRSLPIFWAVILELIASLCMREAFAAMRPAGNRTRMQPAYESETRESVSAAPQAVSTLAPFNFARISQPQSKAMNDNMPLAVYA
jgi:hypothetical protein